MYLIGLREREKDALKIDEVFALYLIDLADSLPQELYHYGCVFVQLLRICLNRHGFEVLSGIKALDNSVYGQPQQINSDFDTANQLVDQMEKAQD
jgi:hypothetical protein